MRARRILHLTLTTLLVNVFCASPSDAQDLAQFYRGRVITLYLATASGGSWDVYLQTLVRHLGNHIPGHPKVVLEYMPGAGGARMLNFMANVAPKDGSAMGTPLPTSLLSAELDPSRSHFAPPTFQWIGSMARIQDVISVWRTAPVQSIADARRIPASMGATGTGSNTYFDIMMSNALLHTKFKLIMGYKGSSDLDLAIERREIDGRADTWDDWLTAHPQWTKRGDIRQLVQIGPTKLPELKNVPLFSDLVASKKDKRVLNFLSAGTAVGRPVFLPPGTPKDRVDALRTAFAATMTDPDYVKDALARKMSVGDWASGEAIQKIVEQDFDVSPDLIRYAKTIVNLH